MQPFSVIEATIYNLLRSVPLLLLAFYPFRGKKRYSSGMTVVLYFAILFIWLAESFICVYILPTGTLMGIVEIIGFAMIAGLYAAAFREHLGKMLFFCFMLINTGYLITILSRFLEGLLFPDLVMDRYRWSASVCLIIVSIIVLLPVYRFFKWVRENMSKEVRPASIWRYGWLVPVIFYLIWSHDFYTAEDTVLWSMSVNNIVYLMVVNLGSFMIYYMMLRIIMEYDDFVELREENHVLSMQLLQYDGLNQRIALARQGRHDLRHHILTMDNLVKKGDMEALRTYLTEIGSRYQLEGPLSYCSNTTVNGILTYFSELASAENIELKVTIDLPEDVQIAKTDLSILFGNLLENAVEACQKQKAGTRKISVRGHTTQNTFALAIDNTYVAVPEKDRSGRFRSMKHFGPGIGTESVKNIVSRYNGVIQFETRGDLFCVSAMLYLQ